MKKDKEFALFKRAAEEAARIDGRELMNADAAEAFEPADEAARARFEAALKDGEVKPNMPGLTEAKGCIIYELYDGLVDLTK